MRVVDEHTVVVVTSRPRPLLLARLAGILILPRDTPDSEVWQPMGTGPWVFTGGSTGSGGQPIRGRRFERYWGPKPSAFEFRIEATPDEGERTRAAVEGADVTSPLPRAALDASGSRSGRSASSAGRR